MPIYEYNEIKNMLNYIKMNMLILLLLKHFRFNRKSGR